MYTTPLVKDRGIKRVEANGLTLLRYMKPLPSCDPTGLYRCVVYKNDKLVAFTPPKMTPYEDFKKQVQLENAVAREYVDGTMVYAYQVDGAWCLGTRSTVDAKTCYRTGLARPFSAALATPTLDVLFRERAEQEGLFTKMDPTLVYVFSFMHPSAFNVNPGSGIYLVAAYRVDGDTAAPVEVADFQRPPLYPTASYEALERSVLAADHGLKGVVLYDPATDRYAKFMNPAYVHVNQLLVYANMNRNLAYHLRDGAALATILQLYPFLAANLADIQRYVATDFPKLLGESYKTCFVLRQKKHKDFPPMLKPHLYNLHSVFLNNLKPFGKRVNNYIVFNYVSKLKEKDLAFLIQHK